MGPEIIALVSIVSAAVFELVKRKVAEDGLTEDEKAKLRFGVAITGSVVALVSWGTGMLGGEQAGHLGLAIVGAMSARDAVKGAKGVAAQKGRGSSSSFDRPPEPPLP